MSRPNVHPIFRPILDRIAPAPRTTDKAALREVIAQQESAAVRIRVGSHSLRRWPNGTLIIEGPNGDGAQVPEAEVENALAQLLRRSF